jgi:hypothetical protein
MSARAVSSSVRAGGFGQAAALASIGLLYA